ncbi:hypothetical protein OZX68_05370 [Streptococcaceae bacterium ESL0729]|nr:hypothetical protein OZX68_05370 [Streptococcaceae bacterium ESL0729]
MKEKINKVQFPCIPDGIHLEVDDRVLYTNDELLTKRNVRRAELELLETAPFPRPDKKSPYEKAGVFTQVPQKEQAKKGEVKLPTTKPRKKTYRAPERPKGYVYPTERMSNLGNSNFNQRPLGGNKVTGSSKAWTQLPLPVTVEVKDHQEGKFERPEAISSRILSSNVSPNKHTKSPRNFDALAKESREIQEEKKQKSSESKNLGSDYFERKRNTLFERGSY